MSQKHVRSTRLDCLSMFLQDEASIDSFHIVMPISLDEIIVHCMVTLSCNVTVAIWMRKLREMKLIKLSYQVSQMIITFFSSLNFDKHNTPTVSHTCK